MRLKGIVPINKDVTTDGVKCGFMETKPWTEPLDFPGEWYVCLECKYNFNVEDRTAFDIHLTGGTKGDTYLGLSIKEDFESVWNHSPFTRLVLSILKDYNDHLPVWDNTVTMRGIFNENDNIELLREFVKDLSE